MNFLSMVREVGNSNIITIPKNVVKTLKITNKKIYEFSINEVNKDEK